MTDNRMTMATLPSFAYFGRCLCPVTSLLTATSSTPVLLSAHTIGISLTCWPKTCQQPLLWQLTFFTLTRRQEDLKDCIFQLKVLYLNKIFFAAINRHFNSVMRSFKGTKQVAQKFQLQAVAQHFTWQPKNYCQISWETTKKRYFQ